MVLLVLHWISEAWNPKAKFYYESGDIEAVVDPAIAGEYWGVHSVWKVAETAVRCIGVDARRRLCMAEVVKEVYEAIPLERTPRDEGQGGRAT
uniref:Serine-threonine/tyrosine-protein kinase catalytic domain-containing protein n=1 Tax=Aegilops tauschii TaxID=37682 RepID=N1R4F7_AEGTA